ncbi:MAG: NosD domain-containing protein, partial [Candidatus Hodarchaeota archaeon]
MHKTLIGLVVVLLIFPYFGFHQVILMRPAPTDNTIDNPQERLTVYYKVHPPISIWGNSGFASQAADEGWPGTGTNIDPYIIDGLNISDYPSELIKIRNVDAYFIIRNCVLANGTTGIYFEEVSNGQIINNTISKNDQGIILTHSANNTLTQNTFSKNGLYINGRTIEECLQQTVHDNTVNGKPLVFWQNVVEGIVPAGAGQVILINASSVTVRNQDTSDATVGIQALFCNSLDLSYNNLCNNSHFGYFLKGSIDNIISQNTLSGNDIGIFLWSSANNTLTNNSLHKNNLDGISLLFSANNTLFQNVFNNNGLYIYGQTVEECLQRTVYDNTVNGKPLVFWQHVAGGIVPTGAGQVILINTSAVTVRNQDISDATVGIQAMFCDSLDLSDNSLSKNSYFGLLLESSTNNTLTNNTLYKNSDSGISLWDSANNTLTDNSLINSGSYGIVLHESDNNTISRNNFIGNNPEGGELGRSQALNNGASNTFILNYWDDWRSPDSDEDGIVDIPYELDGGPRQDISPVIVPYETGVHFLTEFTLTYPTGGEVLTGLITILWIASIDSWGHSLTYSVSYSADEGTTWRTLATYVLVTSHDWNTTAVDNGTRYLVQVRARCSEGVWCIVLSDAVFTIDNVLPNLSSTLSTTPPPFSDVPLNLFAI